MKALLWKVGVVKLHGVLFCCLMSSVPAFRTRIKGRELRNESDQVALLATDDTVNVKNHTSIAWPWSKSEDLNVRVWRAPSTVEEEQEGRWFPEVSSLEKSTTSTGLCLSGGGSRSFSASLGVLRALQDMGLLKHVRYMAGVSGGSWATALYSFAQTPTTDEQLLGDILSPENITLAELKRIDWKSARSVPANWWNTRIATEVMKSIAGLAFGRQRKAWENVISHAVFEAFGIEHNSLFTWDDSTRNDIVSRNPQLEARTWLLPPRGGGRWHRPFPIIDTTLMGPVDLFPLSDNRTYGQIEITPLYVGVPFTSNITYHSIPKGDHTVMVGGLMEPFAYDGQAPEQGLPEGQVSGVLQVPTTKSREFPLARAAAQSSYLAVNTFEGKWFANFLGNRVSEWSPSNANPTSTNVDIADGGLVDNTGLMSMLRRRVERIIVILNVETPLKPASAWDPTARLPDNTEFDSNTAGYFGIFTDPAHSQWDYDNNAVFPRKDFARVAQALQSAQLKGKGAVTTTKLVTIDNPIWGISEGIHVEVTWVYLSRMQQWERHLQPEMANLAVPRDVHGESLEDPSAVVQSGPFKNFPHVHTSNHYSAEVANLLATFAGSSIRFNEDLLKQALKPREGEPGFVAHTDLPAET